DTIPAGVMNAGSDCWLMSEIAAQVDQLDARIVLMHFAQNLQRAIAAAVVDADQLPGIADRVQRLGHALAKLREIFLLVEDGNDDGDHGARDNKENWLFRKIRVNQTSVRATRVPASEARKVSANGRAARCGVHRPACAQNLS